MAKRLEQLLHSSLREKRHCEAQSVTPHAVLWVLRSIMMAQENHEKSRHSTFRARFEFRRHR